MMSHCVLPRPGAGHCTCITISFVPQHFTAALGGPPVTLISIYRRETRLRVSGACPRWPSAARLPPASLPPPAAPPRSRAWPPPRPAQGCASFPGYGVMADGTTTYVNASVCTVNYQPVNPPIVIDLPTPRNS